ncbi:MAG: hypothetical protein EWM72_02207 [Nitrospira sp.]|nr:MAG: hypothetical protein EWM72_02207 [Nitrospira sp.]
MRFMITWQFHQGKLHDGLSLFLQMTPEQDRADRGSNIKLIGRWHDLVRGRGVAICESDSAEAISNWALKWNSLLDVDVAVVLDDNEARALGKNRAKQS